MEKVLEPNSMELLLFHENQVLKIFFSLIQNFPIQIFNGHRYTLQTSLLHPLYGVPTMLAIKNVISVHFDAWSASQMSKQ